MTLDEDLPEELDSYYRTVDNVEGAIQYRNQQLENVFGTFLDQAADLHGVDSRHDLEHEHLQADETYDLLDSEAFESEIQGVLNEYFNLSGDHQFSDNDAQDDVISEQLHQALHGLTVEDYKTAVESAARDLPKHQLTGGRFLEYLQEKVPEYEKRQQETISRVKQQAFDRDTLEALVSHAGAEDYLETGFMRPEQSVVFGDLYREQGELPQEVVKDLAVRTNQHAALQGEAEIAADDYSSLIDEAETRGVQQRDYQS